MAESNPRQVEQICLELIQESSWLLLKKLD